jgi:hypothetical protein
MNDSAFQARSNLNRTLTYRPHLKISYYGMMGLAAFTLLLVLVLSTAAYLSGASYMAGLMAGFGILAPLILYVEAQYFVRPLAFVKVKVHQTGLTLEGPDGTIEIPFQDVRSVSFSHLPYVGGWFKLAMKNGTKFRFTVVLERSEYILEMLAAARPDIVNSKDMMNYRRTAVLAEHSWARASDKLKNYPSLLLKYVAAPIALTIFWMAGTVYYAEQPFPGTYAVAVTVMVMFAMNFAAGLMITFLVGEFLVVSNGRENMLADASVLKRDYVFEKRVDRYGHIAHWILAFGLVTFALARFQF